MPANSACRRGMSSGMVTISATRARLTFSCKPIGKMPNCGATRASTASAMSASSSATMIGNTSSMATMNELVGDLRQQVRLDPTQAEGAQRHDHEQLHQRLDDQVVRVGLEEQQRGDRAVEALEDGALGAEGRVVQRSHRKAGLHVEQAGAERDGRVGHRGGEAGQRADQRFAGQRGPASRRPRRQAVRATTGTRIKAVNSPRPVAPAAARS